MLGGDLSNWPCASLVSSTSSCSSYICFLRRFVDDDALSSSWQTVVKRVGDDLRSLAPFWISLISFHFVSPRTPFYVAIAISRNGQQRDFDSFGFVGILFRMLKEFCSYFWRRLFRVYLLQLLKYNNSRWVRFTVFTIN